MKAARTPLPVRSPVHFLAVGCGAGLIPWAPGTWGTLVAVPLYLVLAGLPLPLYLAVLAALFLLGVYLCERTSRDAGVHDHPGIVWDEVVGYLLTMTAVPADWYWVLAGFVLFRAFDIIKPWPIRFLDRYVEGGFGIMIDDVVAALFALPILHALRFFLA